MIPIVMLGVFIPLMFALIGVITENSFIESLIIGIKFGWGIIIIIFVTAFVYALLMTLVY